VCEIRADRVKTRSIDLGVNGYAWPGYTIKQEAKEQHAVQGSAIVIVGERWEPSQRSPWARGSDSDSSNPGSNSGPPARQSGLRGMGESFGRRPYG
jgi:hypothetical protein